MTTKIQELTIEGVTYVPKSSISSAAEPVDGLPFVLVRTYSAGVHFGYLKRKSIDGNPKHIELIKARRIWSWSGANELNQVAMEGLKNPDSSKISMENIRIELTEAIEIITISQKSKEILDKVKVWKA